MPLLEASLDEPLKVYEPDWLKPQKDVFLWASAVRDINGINEAITAIFRIRNNPEYTRHLSEPQVGARKAMLDMMEKLLYADRKIMMQKFISYAQGNEAI